MRYCFSDTETYCETPIKNGTFAYAENVEVLLWTYAFEGGDVNLWDVASGEPMPFDLKEALEDPEVIFIFHNSVFDVTVIREALDIDIPIHRVRCSMAKAYAHGLPGSLARLSDVLGLGGEQKKSEKGHDLIRLFCLPPAKNSKRGRATSKTHPEKWEAFKGYARQDIVAMREVWSRLPEWNYCGEELKLWMLDAKINRRGMYMDLALVNSSICAVERAQTTLRARTEDLTLGTVCSATKRDALMAHILAAYGVDLPDMTASHLEKKLEDPDLPAGLRELLMIRLQATTSSTAKYKKILKCVSSDGRLRGTLQWCGASRTGRDGGRLFQPQNLPRPTVSNAELVRGVEALKSDCADILYPDVMALAASAIRGVIIPSPGTKLLVADLANIEGRYAAWVAGEEWKLQAFRDFDTILGYDEKGKALRKGYDLYKLSYAKSFNVRPEDVTKKQRNEVGKTLELSMQFGGGCGAFVTFALNFNVNLDELVKDAWEAIPEDIRKEAEAFWNYSVKQKRTLDLEKDVFITCDSLKRMWRLSHPKIVSLWKEIQGAIQEAVSSRGVIFTAGGFKILRDGNWLRIVMPSGRSLCYPYPRIDNEGQVSFMGIDQRSRKWSRINSYGPKFFENAVQGGARDIFMKGVINAEDEGYACVSRIHDEQICEVPDTSEYTSSKLCTLMTTNIPWAKGLPLAAEGFETKFYKKAD